MRRTCLTPEIDRERIELPAAPAQAAFRDCLHGRRPDVKLMLRVIHGGGRHRHASFRGRVLVEDARGNPLGPSGVFTETMNRTRS